MEQRKPVDTLHTTLKLPRDVIEKMITLQRDKCVSVSQLASEAVIQYLRHLPDESTHHCDECNALLPLTEFYVQKRIGKPFRLCKEHHKARSTRWQQENRAYVSEQNRKRYQLRKARA